MRSFSCWDQFLCLAFAQLTWRESLRDIELCLRTTGKRLYHLGIRGHVSRNTLARANAVRDWRIYETFAKELIRVAQQLFAQDSFGVELEEVAYALDSTTIDLCLTLFPWADFRQTKAAVKLHTLLNLRGNIPTFIRITPGKVHDVRILDQLPIETGAIYIMARGYLDFRRQNAIHRGGAFFVIRHKANLILKRLYSSPTDRSSGVICDQTVRLGGLKTAAHYPDHLRRIRFHDSLQKRAFVFLTNHFRLPPLSICQLYKCRWQVELFFKWIKQHLRIKSFYGTSENAVKTQIWIAIAVYVLVAILKKRLDLPHSLYTILQFLSVHLFEKTPIYQALSDYNSHDNEVTNCKQLKLFDF